MWFKRAVRYGIKLLCNVAALIWSYDASVAFHRFKTKLYTTWLSKEFKSFGEHAAIGCSINLRGGNYISIGDNVGIGKRTILSAYDFYRGQSFDPEIFIGNNTSIGEDCHITAINRIVIGNDVLIGKKVTITDNSHGKTELEQLIIPPIKRPLYSKGPVIIGDNVWIGDKATILPNVVIGKNSIIGANALVTKDVPENSVVGGVPAKIIKIIER